MSRPSFPPDAASAGNRSSKLPQVAVAAAAGAILSSRSRLGGALVLGGLAWLASRRPSSPVPEASLPASLDDLCAPSAPFLESLSTESSSPAPDWEDLRSSLQPPPSLFTPPSVPAAPAPTSPLADSPLLHAAPVFVEVEENAPPRGTPQSILPDTIAIPTTPDPPPELLAETEPPVTALPTSFTTIQPKAGLRLPPTDLPAELPPLEFPTPPPLPRRKTFLEWLREA